MFNLFGKPSQEQMLKYMVDSGLEYYKHLSECATQEGQETAQVLAQAVMKFSKDADTNTDESAINFGRVCVALAVMNLTKIHAERGNAHLLNLKDTLQFVLSTPTDVLHKMGVWVSIQLGIQLLTDVSPRPERVERFESSPLVLQTSTTFIDY